MRASPTRHHYRGGRHHAAFPSNLRSHFQSNVKTWVQVRRRCRPIARGLGEPLPGCSEELSMKYLVAFLRNESGATAIEYGLIAAGISVAIIVVVQGVGTNLSGT